MDTQLRKEIITFLTPLQQFQMPNSRQALLLGAGLDNILESLDLTGSAGEFVTRLVQRLDQYGTLEDGTPALVKLLQELETQVGSDKQVIIQGVCERVLKGGRDANAYNIEQLTVYVDSRPTEPEQIPVSTDIGPNPYKGLSAFQETDAERFFGRERVTQALWDKFCALHERPLDGPVPLRLLAILGPSGSGKSSIARAGLLPRLAKHVLPGKQCARVAVFTPGTRPLKTLATILARIATGDPAPVAEKLEFTNILKQQTDDQWEGLLSIVETLPDIDAQPLILLIDQFEEVYTKDVQPEERQQFLDNLLCAAADPSSHVSVILTLRSDFLGQTQRHPAFNQAIADNGVLISVMNEAELRKAIAKPAENAGHALDEACVDLLIEQTRDRQGALPLLQFALTRIWDGLAEGVSPADTLKQIGGVGGALAGEAQRLFGQLNETDQAIARRAFLALVQLGEGTRDTRRRISLSEVVAHGEEPAHVQTVIRCFADPHARLVTLSATPDGNEIAEVTHEALLDHWETLKEWLDANREDLRFHRHLAQDAAYWEEQGRPDGKLWRPPDLDLLRQYYQRAGQDMTPLQVEFFEASVRKERYSRRVRRIAVAAIVSLAVLMSVAAGLAFLAYNQANKQKAEAIRQKLEVERQLSLSTAQSLVLIANQDTQDGKRERAALLVRQAYFLNQQNQGPDTVNDQIDAVLRKILLIRDEKTDDLIKQVCRKVSRNLTLDEWREIAGTDIDYERCPDLPDSSEAAKLILHLRSTPKTTEEIQELSLNVLASGYTATNIDNDFEDLGEVVVDHTTGLMWQKSASEDYMKYEGAPKYIQQLNTDKFAGYTDWRLPTIEELLSLVEPEKQSNDFYIHPIFDKEWMSYWSADLRQTKGKSSPDAAWGVGFNCGLATWYFLDNDVYVRAVRSPD